MPAAQRTVRHLHLKAPAAEQARRLLPVLDDALRCASLGDGEGTRLLVVRRLALGPIAAGISAQALSRLIEQRSAEARQHWVDAAHATADSAGCVAFSGALDARVRLALRLLRGQPCGAWYWPLAVPEYSAQADTAATLRAIAWTVSRWPEARSALPAWLAAAVQAGQAAPLARAIGPVLGPALLQQAGLGPVPARPVDRAAVPAAHSASVRAAAPARRAAPTAAPHAALPAWLQHALQLAPPTWLPPGPPAAAQAEPLLPAPIAAPGGRVPAPSAAAPTPARMHRRQPAPPRAPRQQSRLEPETPTASGLARPAVPAPPALAQPPWLEPTSCGGLLFLLPVLQRLQWPQWLQTQPADTGPRCTAMLLYLALRRLAAPPDDPLWRLALPPDDDPHAALAGWLADARRWLHRAGRLGLATLARRPARVALTPTHVDLFFRLDQGDLRLRRLGLDLDPGWLPWLGRVVAFHYGDVP
nr:hypothetical protein [Variovorax boronicumulans]